MAGGSAQDSGSESCTPDLYRVWVDGLSGFVNSDGDIVIEPVYENADPLFDDRYAAVQRNGRWGFIDADGQEVIEPQFDVQSYFSEDLAEIRLGERTGYVDRDGHIRFLPNGQRAIGPFICGLAPVVVEDMVGFLDKDLKIVIKPQFDNYSSFDRSTCLANVRRDGRWFYIDHNGNRRITCDRDCGGFFEGMAYIIEDGRYGFIDSTGEVAIEPVFQDVWWFEEGLVAAKLGAHWGFLDSAGKWAIEPQFDEVEICFSNGLAPIRIGELWGYVDKTGTIVIEPQFFHAQSCGRTLCRVTTPDGDGLVDHKGNWVWRPSA